MTVSIGESPTSAKLGVFFRNHKRRLQPNRSAIAGFRVANHPTDPKKLVRVDPREPNLANGEQNDSLRRNAQIRYALCLSMTMAPRPTVKMGGTGTRTSPL